jgi:hypothetical protein
VAPKKKLTNRQLAIFFQRGASPAGLAARNSVHVRIVRSRLIMMGLFDPPNQVERIYGYDVGVPTAWTKPKRWSRSTLPWTKIECDLLRSAMEEDGIDISELALVHKRHPACIRAMIKKLQIDSALACDVKSAINEYLPKEVSPEGELIFIDGDPVVDDEKIRSVLPWNSLYWFNLFDDNAMWSEELWYSDLPGFVTLEEHVRSEGKMRVLETASLLEKDLCPVDVELLVRK